MSRHPRDRWEYPAGPGDHRFDYRFDNQVHRHNPYYPEAREDFHYRERSPLRKYSNPPDPYHYESYDYADAYRRRPVYDPQSYPTHGDFTPDDADIIEDVVTEEYHLNEWEDEDEDLVVVRRSWRPCGRDPHTDSGTKATETNGVGASGTSTSGASTSGAGVNRTRPSGSSVTEAEPELVPDHREIASLLVSGVTTVQSKEVSKEFPLKFEEEGFSLMPPKLDSWMSRRAKEKGVFKLVNAREEALVKTQLKIMDIGPPLIDVYGKLTAVADESAVTLHIRRSIQAALQQWGRAFAHISKKRRDAVVNVTDPRVEYLLKDENVFATGKEAHELLFTGNFLDLMLKEASQDETLARRDKAIAVATRGRRNPVRSTRRDQPRDPPSHQVHFGVYQQSDRGRGRGRRVFMDLRGGRGSISRRVIEYLGMVIDSTLLSFALPTVKVQEVKKMCKKALDTGKVPLRDVASILGNFTWAIPTIPFAQSHYRSMQRIYITDSQKALGDLNVKCVLSVGSSPLNTNSADGAPQVSPSGGRGYPVAIHFRSKPLPFEGQICTICPPCIIPPKKPRKRNEK
ncbi:hypothetical protein OUZ56_030131 [Daphnia magna]|uniref:Reverse transcriptase domain-containing protein n=1 Tax=Daphnia magna TaxID=35525 RepID=A0ABQ9ZQT3_9CRUS|nr:hypothetical protein OUZ56_030131 [Daphnia magna]